MTGKLVVAYFGWLLAASALAILFGVLIGELAAAVGLVESLSMSQRRVVEIAGVCGLVVLALLPFLLRRRILRSEGDSP